jgi:hypothetical protein
MNTIRATDKLLALMHDIVKTWGIENEKNRLKDPENEGLTR